MSLNMQNALVKQLTANFGESRIADVRIGLGYSAVRLDSGHTGLAWTPPPVSGGCSHLKMAGTLSGRPAVELLQMLATEQPLLRTIGLATANALLACLPQPTTSKEEVVDGLQITAADHVAMVGYFGPLVKRLQESGCRLDIIELDSSRPGVLSPQQGRSILAGCSVAILTGTSLVTGTIDELLDDLGRPREAVLLGPSAPFCAEVFAGTPLTRIAGARVLDGEGVLKVVSEGGGTPLFKPYVSFETLLLGPR
ncbi:MAG: hypothetical protein BA870_03400 [Desulfuromonadales bacterium C00003094]|jgi:uncharacterized protein (DUF4213/DUF364 family)|nr:MAG: hypothetical protein BA870_03400 [Desulfuromonadales bacterium C00003094]OEU76633.1 MAG: hypothetical protein BA869_03450 [Desulfuromonadales bacterium C00003107]